MASSSYSSSSSSSSSIHGTHYVVIQWNDYRKENFLAFLGGFTSLDKACEVQIRCLERFQNEGWISNTRCMNVKKAYPIRTYPLADLSVEGLSPTNLIVQKFVPTGIADEDGFVDEPENFTVGIFAIKSPKSASNGFFEVNVQTYWRGFIKCVVEEEMPLHLSIFRRSEVLSEESYEIDLSNLDKLEDDSEPCKQFKNHRYDYAKYCIHRYVFRYVQDYEYPTLTW